MFNVSIPQISDEEIKIRYQHIKPVIRLESDGKLYWLGPIDEEKLDSVSFLWNSDDNLAREVEEGELKELKDEDFACVHAYGFPGFFKPSVAEVLAQIPQHIIPFVKAFELVEYPQVEADFYKDALTKEIFYDGYHVS